MRDEPKDGRMSETIDRMVLKTYLDRLLTQALTLSPPHPLPQGVPLALKHVAQPQHGENLSRHGLTSPQGSGID